ncbi:MAG: hypothetical protein MUC59_17805, partial [Saprospiraceae bacterium]|nr:hypothetical protein [Saprospiraceae bacterium]
MKKKITLLVSFMLCLGMFSTSLLAQDWVLKKDKSGIKVYVKEQVGSNIKELKFTTTIEASMSTIAAVLTHIEGFDDWSYGVNSSRVIKRVSDSEIYYHCNVDFPWPFDDRDLILHSTVWQDKKTMALHSKSTSSPTMEKE